MFNIVNNTNKSYYTASQKKPGKLARRFSDNIKRNDKGNKDGNATGPRSGMLMNVPTARFIGYIHNYTELVENGYQAESHQTGN